MKIHKGKPQNGLKKGGAHTDSALDKKGWKRNKKARDNQFGGDDEQAAAVQNGFPKKSSPFNKQSKNKFKPNQPKKFDENGEPFQQQQQKKPQQQQEFTHEHKKKKKNGEKLSSEHVVRHIEGKKWYQYQVDEKVVDATKDRVSEDELRTLEQEADLILRADVDLYSRAQRHHGGSEAAWLQTILEKGTAGDRKTAMTLQIKGSPVHCISYLGSLVHTVERQNVREAMDLIPMLTEMFVEELLPTARKLFSFGSRPLARLGELSSQTIKTRRRILAMWKFEHELKGVFERFTKALEAISGGAVENLCMRALTSAQNLLSERPEQEQFLLTLLVNKMGHPNNKVAAKAEQLMIELSRKQMNMRPVMVTEVERLIYRRNVSERAQQHAANFLAHLVLRAGEADLAVQLLSIYFGLFRTLVAQKKTENRLVGTLLDGANRAFPYAKGKADSISEDMDALFRLVHDAPFPVALQTLKLLHQVLSLSESMTDRFFSALYRKLLDHIPTPSQRPLLDLLWKTLKADTVDRRVRTFVKRLLQVATTVSAPFAAGILFLISKLLDDRQSLIVIERAPMSAVVLESSAKTAGKKAATYNEVDEDNDEEEELVDLDDDFKPIKRMTVKKEEPADDDVKILPGSSTSSKQADKKDSKKAPLKGSLQPLQAQGWVHRKNQAHHGGVSLYDPAGRNPLFISTDGSIDAELLLLKNHYHPSVGVFASSILQGQPISYGGDPLADFTAIAFLDRFVYRNPKTTKTRHGRVDTGVKALGVRSKEYATKSVEEIPADERFLHHYAKIKFAEKDEKKGRKRRDEEEDWDDIESVNSEEFEQVMARFEPGEANDEFDIDFSKEFGSEKKRKPTKRKADDEDDEENEDGEGDNEDMDEDLDMESDEENEDEEEDDEDGDEDEDEDEESDEDDVVVEGEESDEDFVPSSNKRRGGRYSDDEDEDDDADYGDNDAFVSADRLAEVMEEFGVEGEKKKGKRNREGFKGQPKAARKHKRRG